MIKPEQVPPGLALIARKAWAEGAGPTNDDDWNAALAAALSAWPGMIHKHGDFRFTPQIILPLTEKQDDKA